MVAATAFGQLLEGLPSGQLQLDERCLDDLSAGETLKTPMQNGLADPPAAMAMDPAAKSVERPLENRVWGRASNRAESPLPERQSRALVAEHPQVAPHLQRSARR